MHFVCVELVEPNMTVHETVDRSSRRTRHVERVVSRRDVTNQVEFGLYFIRLEYFLSEY